MTMVALMLAFAAAGAETAPMVRVPAGRYQPLYGAPSADGRAPRPRVPVASFVVDVRAVTNGEYLEFVRAHPEWRRSHVKPIFADSGYLRHWAGDLDLGAGAPPSSPVVSVSWFAARAYLHAAGKELPTVDQWEYVAAAGPVKAYGVSDLHGVIQEWTLDFNSSLVTGESRADADLDRLLYCGAGAVGAADFEDYAAFMRYAYRSSLEARYTIANLGFRGVAADPGRRR